MQNQILDLFKEHKELSYSDIKKILKASDEVLSKELKKIENIYLYKKDGKHYVLIDNVSCFSGLIILKNEKLYIKTETKTYPILEDLTNRKRIYINDRFIFYVLDEKAVLEKFVSHNKHLYLCIASKEKQDKRIFRTYDPNLDIDHFIVYDYPSDIKTYDLCLIEPTYIKDGSMEVGNFFSKISVLGQNDADILNLIIQSKVNYFFTEEYKEEIEKLPNEVLKEELAGREDYTQKTIFTIDGDDSKDFDDAISIEKLDNGNYLLGVHIADVSHYVKEGSLIDQEALSRGTSIYLADRVIPMLDFKLSNNICSLKENEIRLTISCLMEINSKGVVINSRIVKSAIKSKRRMTYSNCNLMLRGDKNTIAKYNDIYPDLLLMQELATIIRNKRNNDGAITFQTNELAFEFDNDGNPTAITQKERGVAEDIIEDFMLSANSEVAKTLYNLTYPCIYRVHEEASFEKLKELEPFLHLYDLKIRNIGSGIKSKDIQAILDFFIDKPQYNIVSNMILRAMAKARYDRESLGHFGLNLDYYCHFTSPIRRYPDLMVHRILTNLLLEIKDFNKDYNHFDSIVSDIATQNSRSERVAMDLERAVTDLEVCKYMNKFIGQKYYGIINSITKYGAYVTLENGVEGLAHVNNMADYMLYDDENKMLVGEFSNDCYNIGDKVEVRLIDVNFNIRKLDFIILRVLRGKKNEVDN